MDFFSDSSALPILAAAAAAVIVAVMAGALLGGELRRLVLPLVAVAVIGGGAWAGWSALDRVSAMQQQRALDARRAELVDAAFAPGSPLACLNGLPGKAVESGCEAAVFATPHAAASAIAHAAARLTLLADSIAYAHRVDPGYATSVAGLRRAVENDAYGLYSHVLAVRDGCTPDRCAAFSLLEDSSTIRAHMREDLYGSHVGRFSRNWGQAVASSDARKAPATGAIPVDAAAKAPAAGAESGHTVPPIASVLPNLSFPSSQSIPPVSIMLPEPPAPASSKPAAQPAPRPRPASPPKAASPPKQP